MVKEAAGPRGALLVGPSPSHLKGSVTMTLCESDSVNRVVLPSASSLHKLPRGLQCLQALGTGC